MNAKWFNKHKIFSVFYKHGLFTTLDRIFEKGQDEGEAAGSDKNDEETSVEGG